MECCNCKKTRCNYNNDYIGIGQVVVVHKNGDLGKVTNKKWFDGVMNYFVYTCWYDGNWYNENRLSEYNGDTSRLKPCAHTMKKCCCVCNAGDCNFFQPQQMCCANSCNKPKWKPKKKKRPMCRLKHRKYKYCDMCGECNK